MERFKGTQKTYLKDLFKLVETKQEVTKNLCQKQEDSMERMLETFPQVCINIKVYRYILVGRKNDNQNLK